MRSISDAHHDGHILLVFQGQKRHREADVTTDVVAHLQRKQSDLVDALRRRDAAFFT
jgi:hypothetical protein